MTRAIPALAFISTAILSSCGPQDPVELAPEVKHCAIVAGLATQSYGEISVIEMKDSVLGETRQVQLRFEYPKTAEQTEVGAIKCGYDFGPEARANPKRIVKVKEVHYGGRYLSEDELKFVNTSMFAPRPKFKLKK